MKLYSLTLLLLSAACATPSAASDSLPEVFRPLLLKNTNTLRATVDSAAPALPIRGATRELQAFGESCRWAGPNPVVIRPRTEPRVGTPLIVRWTLGGMTPPALHVNAVALLMAFSPIDSPVGFGSLAPGCKLLVRPDHVIMPLSTGWLRFDSTAGLVTMEFTPAPGLEGAQVYVQLIAAVPGANQIGWICSNGLEINIGAAW